MARDGVVGHCPVSLARMATLQPLHNCQGHQVWFPVVSSVVGVVGLEEAMMVMATLAFPRLDYPSVRRRDWCPFSRLGTGAVGNCRASSTTTRPLESPLPFLSKTKKTACNPQPCAPCCVGRRHAASLLRCHRRRRQRQQRAQPQQRRKRLKRRWAQRQPQLCAPTKYALQRTGLSARDSPVFSAVRVLPSSSLLPSLPSLRKLTIACMQRHGTSSR